MRRTREDDARGRVSASGRAWSPAAVVAMVALTLAVGACTPARHRPMRAYVDPEGLFSAELPDANDLEVIAADTTPSTVTVLTGVSSTPPSTTSDLPVSTTGSSADRSIWSVFVVASTSGFGSVDEVADLVAGSDLATVERREPVMIDGRIGTLVVGELASDTGSAGFALGATIRDDRGYLVIEYFQPGSWSSEEQDFRDVVASFTTAPLPGASTLGEPSGG